MDNSRYLLWFCEDFNLPKYDGNFFVQFYQKNILETVLRVNGNLSRKYKTFQ